MNIYFLSHDIRHILYLVLLYDNILLRVFGPNNRTHVGIQFSAEISVLDNRNNK